MNRVDFLLINPWIYDFSAHDFWLRPYGLLKLAGRLRKEGYTLFFLDLLDPFHPKLPKIPKRKAFGTGHFYKEVIPKPTYFLDVPRRLYRYGLPFEVFKDEVVKLQFSAVMLTCTLTYWYPGLFSLLRFFSEFYPEVPIFIGGIYAKLCQDHLQSFVEKHISNPVMIVLEDLDTFVNGLKEKFVPTGNPLAHDYPAFDLQGSLPYVIIQSSHGCPFSCPYCASRRLNPTFKQRDPKEVVEEILFWHIRFGVIDFAFYDDALLVNFENHLGIIIESLLEKNLKLRFHTPNALHARFITRDVADLLKRVGFTTIRLGFERLENRIDNKVTTEEFIEAVQNLKEAGFTSREIGAYVLFGLPDEDFEEVKKSLHFLEGLRVSPFLAEFSPVPGTYLFEIAKSISRYPIEEDPLFHNKSVFPALKKPSWEKIQEIKDLAREIRARLETRLPL